MGRQDQSHNNSYDAVTVPTAIYGSEARVMRKTDGIRMQTAQMNFFE
jgi:hypothetical protein